MDPKQVAKQMIVFNKTAFDNNFRAMQALQEQTERLVGRFWEKSPMFPEEGKRRSPTGCPPIKKAATISKASWTTTLKKWKTFSKKPNSPPAAGLFFHEVFMDHPHIVERMTRPDFYPHRPQKVEAVQTHISYVFIAGDYVYKVKKPVNFGFLDFTTLEKRKFYCEEELRLNRRLAPSIYLDVAPIGRDDAGRLTLGKTANIVEYAVLMNKLPLDKMLKILLARGKADAGIMDAVAKKSPGFIRKPRRAAASTRWAPSA